MRHVTHNLEGPIQSSWQKAPHFLQTIMALRLQEQESALSIGSLL